jgi:DNA-binding NarL/FixJ family response regulator
VNSVRDARTVPDRTTLNILAALSRGKSVTEAAMCCNVSESTLRRKLALLREQWTVHSTVQMIVLAVRRGLI